jgi:hypothetical protein
VKTNGLIISTGGNSYDQLMKIMSTVRRIPQGTWRSSYRYNNLPSGIYPSPDFGLTVNLFWPELKCLPEICSPGWAFCMDIITD